MNKNELFEAVQKLELSDEQYSKIEGLVDEFITSENDALRIAMSDLRRELEVSTDDKIVEFHDTFAFGAD